MFHVEPDSPDPLRGTPKDQITPVYPPPPTPLPLALVPSPCCSPLARSPSALRRRPEDPDAALPAELRYLPAPPDASVPAEARRPPAPFDAAPPREAPAPRSLPVPDARRPLPRSSDADRCVFLASLYAPSRDLCSLLINPRFCGGG